MCNITFDTEHLSDDPNELKAIIVALLESVVQAKQTDVQNQKTIDELLAEVSRLNLRIEQLLEMIFGKKSEKGVTKKEDEKSDDHPKEEPNSEASSLPSDSADASRTPETPENPVPKIPKRKKEKNGGGGRMTIPADFPVRIVDIHPPEAERTCGECDTPFKHIGKSVSRRIVFIPATFEVEETHIHAYAGDCPCSDCAIAKPEPDIQPIDKGLISTSLLAIMIIMKYVDHLPLARQASQVFFRSGLKFAQSSMCRWMEACRFTAVGATAPIEHHRSRWSLFAHRHQRPAEAT